MNEDGEADANDLASEFETDRTRQKIRRDLAKFRRRLQERVQCRVLVKIFSNRDLFQSKRDQNGGSAAISCHVVASGGRCGRGSPPLTGKFNFPRENLKILGPNGCI